MKMVELQILFALTYALDSEGFHSVILFNFLCNALCSAGTGIVVDDNIASFLSELQADQFACHHNVKISKIHKRALV